MKKFLISVAVAALAAPMFAQAPPQRFAVIDVNRVLTTSNAGKGAVERLKKMQDEMAKQLSDRKIAMQRFAQDADREVGEARDRALVELEGKIKPVIDQIGKEMGLAAIFNKFESGLVYASDAIDITDTVIQRFNGATGAAPAAANQPAAATPAKKP